MKQGKVEGLLAVFCLHRDAAQHYHYGYGLYTCLGFGLVRELSVLYCTTEMVVRSVCSQSLTHLQQR